jgi:hypothetical protein
VLKLKKLHWNTTSEVCRETYVILLYQHNNKLD